MAKAAAQLPGDMGPLAGVSRFLRRTSYDVFGEDDLAAMLREQYNTSMGFDPMDSRGAGVAHNFADAVQRNRENPDVRPLGSPLTRTAIPSEQLPERDLRAMGFVPSLVAVPERGQKELRTWRHPQTGVHVHNHGKDMLFHEDKWPSIAMLKKRFQLENPGATEAEALKGSFNTAVTEGIPHVVLEGIPGYINYAAGAALGTPTFTDQLAKTRAARQLNPLHKAAPEAPSLTANNIGRGALTASVLGGLAGAAGGAGVGMGVAGGTAGFLAGNQLAGALQRKLPEHSEVANFALAAGLPAALAYGGYRGGRALKNFFSPDEQEAQPEPI